MQTYENLLKITSDIHYKKGWWFKLGTAGDGLFIQVMFEENDEQGKANVNACRKWLIDKRMSDNQVIRTAFSAILKAEEHEVMQKFLYKGCKVANPNIDISKLTDFLLKNPNVDLLADPDDFNEYIVDEGI